MSDKKSLGNRGKEFEKELESTHEYYRMKSLIDVVRNDEKWTFISKYQYDLLKRSNPTMVAVTGNGRTLKREKSDVDFSGGNSNCTVIFDAKEVADNRLSMKRMKPHQIHRLEQAKKCGVTSGFMVKFTELKRVFFLPIEFASEKSRIYQMQVGKAQTGTGSISLKEFEEKSIEIFKDKLGNWDWFSVIIK